jgi:DNA (cytosine-5)-methyltransferase 1
VGKHNLPECDVVTAGWPCQGLSVAGRREGLADARSKLFYQFTRIAYELQPTYLVWENVPGLYSSDDGRDMCRVLMEFQRIGYHGAWRVLDAQYFGMAQRRRRVIGVFARSNLGAAGCAEILSIPEGLRGHPAPIHQARKEITGTLTRSTFEGGPGGGDGKDNGLIAGTLNANGKAAGSATTQDAESGLLICGGTENPDVAGTLGSHCRNPSLDTCGALVVGALSDGSRGYSADAAAAGHYIAFPANLSGTQCAAQSDLSPTLQTDNPTAVAGGYFVRRLTPRECERLQDFPDDWTAGFSDSVRYRMLGNAVNVAKLQWVMERLVKQSGQAQPLPTQEKA